MSAKRCTAAALLTAALVGVPTSAHAALPPTCRHDAVPHEIVCRTEASALAAHRTHRLNAVIWLQTIRWTVTYDKEAP